MINKFTNNEKTKCCMNCKYFINLSTDCPIEAYYPGECQFKNKEKHKVLTFSEAKSMTDEELKETLYIVDEELKNRSDKRREQMKNNLQSVANHLLEDCKRNKFALAFSTDSSKLNWWRINNNDCALLTSMLVVEDIRDKEEK